MTFPGDCKENKAKMTQRAMPAVEDPVVIPGLQSPPMSKGAAARISSWLDGKRTIIQKSNIKTQTRLWIIRHHLALQYEESSYKTKQCKNSSSEVCNWMRHRSNGRPNRRYFGAGFEIRNLSYELLSASLFFLNLVTNRTRIPTGPPCHQ